MILIGKANISKQIVKNENGITTSPFALSGDKNTYFPEVESNEPFPLTVLEFHELFCEQKSHTYHEMIFTAFRVPWLNSFARKFVLSYFDL